MGLLQKILERLIKGALLITQENMLMNVNYQKVIGKYFLYKLECKPRYQLVLDGFRCPVGWSTFNRKIVSLILGSAFQ